MKAAALVCLAGLAAFCLGKAQAGSHATVSRPPAAVCGHWVVTKVIPTSGISAAPRREFIGMTVEYLPSRMRFGNLVAVRHPKYRVERQSAAKFLRLSHVRLSELGIKGSSVLLVNVLDEKGRDVIRPGAGLEVRNTRQIITDWNGVYYLLERRGAACPAVAPGTKK